MLRPYQPSDTTKLEDLIAALNAADSALQAADFAVVSTGFRNHDPLMDRFVLELEAQIIGHAWIGGDRWDRNDCWLCIAPEHRRKGYGRVLLARILERALERGAVGLSAYLPGREPALEFALESGFEIKGYFRELRLPAGTSHGPATLPDGWKLEPYSESSDVARYARALDASYADLWGHGFASEEVMQMMLATLDPKDAFLVTDAEGLDVGCAGITRGSAQMVDAPGLIRMHRSAKKYQAVLASALTKLEPGLEVRLNSWGDSDASIAAYGELGFVESERTALTWRAV
jgi:GNAT superfamily N-acetyltransferase